MAIGLQNFRLKTLYNLPTYTDDIPNIAMKKRLLLLAILPLSLHAADVPPDVKPELQVNTAEPQQPEAHNIPAEQTNRPSENGLPKKDSHERIPFHIRIRFRRPSR